MSSFYGTTPRPSRRYPWILQSPRQLRRLPAGPPRPPRIVACDNCGWGSDHRRKKCPACYRPLSQTRHA